MEELSVILSKDMKEKQKERKSAWSSPWQLFQALMILLLNFPSFRSTFSAEDSFYTMSAL